MKISVVMPARNAESYLPSTLAPLCGFYAAGLLDEIIVVDDLSTDRSAEIARQMAVILISNSTSPGVSHARNAGAKAALGEIIWFVDADVVVDAQSIHRVRLAFQDESVDAVIGSYDDRPYAKNFLSQYKNLLHHYHHQSAGVVASHFWSGCGAIRKSVFLEVGGFDAERFHHPSVEDIELGYRLRDHGATIVIDRQLQGRHLKRWTVLNLLHTDILRRAVPWSRLLVEGAKLANQFNIAWGERCRALIACAGWLTLVVCLLGVLPLWVLVLWGLAAIASNLPLLQFFRARRGLVFGFLALAIHQIYYLYSTVSFVVVWCLARLGRYA